jgi:hypothetical protein
MPTSMLGSSVGSACSMAWWSSIVGVVAEFGGFGLCDTALEVWGALGLDALNDGGLGVLATVGLGGIYSGVEGRTRLGGGEEGVGLVETSLCRLRLTSAYEGGGPWPTCAS